LRLRSAHHEPLGSGGRPDTQPWAFITAMMRQICKQILTIALAIGLFWPGMAHAQPVVTTIVTDPLTGVAMEGYDPVTYFTDPQPMRGSPDFEYHWRGVPWYFVSEANRDVFKRTPEIYAPQHGGYCEMSLARGYLSDGKPQIYAILKMKLYLFYSAANREAFRLAQGEAVTLAQSNWERLSKDLAVPVTAAAGVVPAANH